MHLRKGLISSCIFVTPTLVRLESISEKEKIFLIQRKNKGIKTLIAITFGRYKMMNSEGFVRRKPI